MATDGELPARIFLRPLGSPLPLGLAGLTTASLVLSGLDLGWVSVAQTKHVAVILLVAALPLQLLACLFALLARDGAAAGGMGFLAAGWAAMGVVRLISVPGSTSPALGLAFVALACLVAGSAAAQGLGKPLAALAIGLAAARFALTGVYELSSASGWQDASGAVGLAVTVVAAYLVWALGFEDAKDRTVLPTVRRGDGAAAMADGAPEQLERVEHEAGVRRQLQLYALSALHTSDVLLADARAVILADAAHHPAQLLSDDWTSATDEDPELARRTRAPLAAELRDSGALIGMTHHAGFGRLTGSLRRRASSSRRRRSCSCR